MSLFFILLRKNAMVVTWRRIPVAEIRSPTLEEDVEPFQSACTSPTEGSVQRYSPEEEQPAPDFAESTMNQSTSDADILGESDHVFFAPQDDGESSTRIESEEGSVEAAQRTESRASATAIQNMAAAEAAASAATEHILTTATLTLPPLSRTRGGPSAAVLRVGIHSSSCFPSSSTPSSSYSTIRRSTAREAVRGTEDANRNDVNRFEAQGRHSPLQTRRTSSSDIEDNLRLATSSEQVYPLESGTRDNIPSALLRPGTNESSCLLGDAISSPQGLCERDICVESHFLSEHRTPLSVKGRRQHLRDVANNEHIIGASMTAVLNSARVSQEGIGSGGTLAPTQNRLEFVNAACIPALQHIDNFRENFDPNRQNEDNSGVYYDTFECALYRQSTMVHNSSSPIGNVAQIHPLHEDFEDARSESPINTHAPIVSFPLSPAQIRNFR